MPYRIQADVDNNVMYGNCGASSLLNLADLNNVKLPPQDVTATLGMVGTHCSMAEIVKVADELGFPLEARQWSYSELCANDRPVLAHLNWGHFVIVTGASTDSVDILDGDPPHIRTASDIFRNQWSGYVLTPASPQPVDILAVLLVVVGFGFVLVSTALYLRRFRTR